MEWQAIVLVIQILMLAVGWFLFQQARGELSARAAETPVMGEVKALQRSIKQLLADMEQSSETASARLEKRCDQARRLLDTLDLRMAEASDLRDSLHQIQPALATSRTDGQSILFVHEGTSSAPELNDAVVVARLSASEQADPPQNARDRRRDTIFALADAGRTQGDIARETGISEGEIEMLLALRLQRA